MNEEIDVSKYFRNRFKHETRWEFFKRQWTPTLADLKSLATGLWYTFLLFSVLIGAGVILNGGLYEY